MKCQFCGNPLAPGAACCPICGVKCESRPIPPSPAPVTEKNLTPEQLSFYAEEEEKCRKEIKSAKKWMIVIPIVCLVPGTVILFLGGLVFYLVFAGIGLIGLWAEAIVAIAASKKLEKIQREKLFR